MNSNIQDTLRAYVTSAPVPIPATPPSRNVLSGTYAGFHIFNSKPLTGLLALFEYLESTFPAARIAGLGYDLDKVMSVWSRGTYRDPWEEIPGITELGLQHRQAFNGSTYNMTLPAMVDGIYRIDRDDIVLLSRRSEYNDRRLRRVARRVTRDSFTTTESRPTACERTYDWMAVVFGDLNPETYTKAKPSLSYEL